MCIAQALKRSETGEQRWKCFVQSSQIKFTSWDARTLVTVDGPVETATHGHCVVEERKRYLLLGELHRCNIEVAGIQKSKLFGPAIYDVEDSIVLSSGRPVPIENF